MRDLILREATRMFIEEGYEKTSIRSIADRIEYSPATIYLYFKDKDEMFFVIHEQGFEKFLAKLEKTSAIEHPYERLFTMGNLYLKFAFDHPEYYDLMFIIRAPMNKIAKDGEWQCGRECFDFFRNTVRECIEKGYMKPISVDVAAFSILSFMHGMASLAIRERFEMYTQEQVKQLMEGSIKMMLGLLENK